MTFSVTTGWGSWAFEGTGIGETIELEIFRLVSYFLESEVDSVKLLDAESDGSIGATSMTCCST